MVVVVADERGLYDLDVLLEVLPVRRDYIAFRAKLLVRGIGGEKIDVRKVSGIALAEMCYEPAEGGEKEEALGSSVMK